MTLLIIFPGDNYYLSIYFVSLVFGFILGSMPFGFLISRLKNIDIRNYGSKNIGFSNVYRTLGLQYGIPVLVLDIAKGFLPTFFANQFGFIPILVGLGTVLGHIFTPWLTFKGGKGVATTIGVMIALIPIALAIAIVIFIVVLIIFPYVSLASLAFAISLPIGTLFLYREQTFILISTVIIVALLFIRHKDNIKRLVHNREEKFSLFKLFTGQNGKKEPQRHRGKNSKMLNSGLWKSM